ncbi:WGxxGxxG-CTERM domain-containing protein [Cohnella sp. LGH]|uniref:MYXO-CTERM domain-containing protein n=1 Tax=Cohnella phaseoli TaxID=456490 RepID=A0A3D9KR55_9BACL|nr:MULTISPECIES: WGxxGxxG family protein [Cohnella]QTH44545.1 WGxxGxxG-CTERM domain-containing protein [Cohnella sp. LGH]RED89151.1 hypothetical protein DFP98_101122 [Cohnella phaseoli]
MKKIATSLALGTCIALASVTPAFAEHTTGTTGMSGDSRTLNGATVPNKTYYPNAGRTDGTMLDRTINGTLGNGTYGNGMYGNGNYSTYNMNGTHGVNGNYGTYDSTRMNAYRPYSSTNMTTRANNTVRRMETTTARTGGFSWGWLGLLGLFGLAGMRSRNREDVR